MYPFYIELTFGYHENDHWVEKKRSVITFAENFTDAMTKIENYYGEELVSIEKMSAYELGDLIELPINVGEQVKAVLEDY